MNLFLSGLFYYQSTLKKIHIYKLLAGFFCFFGLFMLCWYLSSYLVLNIEHRETFIYTSLEALAFIWMGLAVYYCWRTLIELSNQTKFLKYLYLVFVATVLLVLTKYSYYLFGANYPVFFWLKRVIIIGLLAKTIILSVISLSVKQSGSGFPETTRRLICVAVVLLSLAAGVDYFLIKDKFYEGPVRLSMNFPVFLTGYFCFTLLLIVLNLRGIWTKDHSQKIELNKLSDDYQVTPRELEIIGLVIKGKSNQEIAKILYISPATVKNHLRHIFEKLKVSSRYELITMILPVKN